MPSLSPHRPDQSPLELHSGLRQMGGVAVGCVFALLPTLIQLVFPRDDLGFTVAWISSAVCVLILLCFIALRLRLRSMGCLLRLDAAGLTVHGHRTTPWSDIAEVRWVKPGRNLPRSLVFVARPGAALPALPSGLPCPRPEARAAALAKRFGGPLVILPATTSTQATEILASVQRLSDVPLISD